MGRSQTAAVEITHSRTATHRVARALPDHPAVRALQSPIFRYMWRVLRDLKITEPPVSEFAVAEHLGASIRTFPESMLEMVESELGLGKAVPDSWLDTERRIITVKPTLWYARKRFSIFHECAHLILPGHEGQDYECFLDQVFTKDYSDREREADFGACELAMPTYWFLREIARWINISWQSISRLADRHRISLECMAIRYVSYHPEPCALVVCDEVCEPGDDSAEERVFAVCYAITSYDCELRVQDDAIVYRSKPLIESHFRGQTVRMSGLELGMDTPADVTVEARFLHQPKDRLFMLVRPGG